MSEQVLLKAYYHKYDAEIAVGLLKDSGIHAILQSDDAGGFREHLTLGMGNHRVLVQKKDVERAIEALEVLEQDLPDEDIKKVEEIAASKEQEPSSPTARKNQDRFIFVVPVIIAVVFVAVVFVIIVVTFIVATTVTAQEEEILTWAWVLKKNKIKTNLLTIDRFEEDEANRLDAEDADLLGSFSPEALPE